MEATTREIASHGSRTLDQYIRRPIPSPHKATRAVGFGNVTPFIPFNYSPWCASQHHSPLTGGWRPRHQAPRPRSIPLQSGFVPSHSTGLMEPVTLHHLPGTRTPTHGTPLGDYVTRDHLVTRHLAFGSRMLRPWPPDTCRYTWPRPHLALVPPNLHRLT